MGDSSSTGYVDVGGADVAFRVIGRGPIDLLYFYGLGSHVDMYSDDEYTASWLAGLSSFSRLIFFDRRGTGLSDPVALAEAPSWEAWTEDIRAVLDVNDIDRAAIFASADAGPIAMLFAASSPERVAALVLANTSARFLEAEDYPIGVDHATIDSLVTVVRDHWGTPALLELTSPEAARDPALAARVATRMRASATPRTAAMQLRYVLEHVDVRDALPLITAPTLVLHNARNPVVPASHGRHIAANIDGARYVEIDASATGLLEGRPAALDEIMEFLTGARAPGPTDRMLATVLFTDIVNSTSRAAATGDQQWRATLDHHDGTVRRVLAQFGGHEVKMTGDGLLATFDGPARAIRCARAIVRTLGSGGIDIRAGIHTGECDRRGDDISGLAVHIAARVAASAGAGEVRVSRTVVDLVAGSSIAFRDCGTHDLKGLPNRWRLFTVEST